jgi:hypothetical protein
VELLPGDSKPSIIVASQFRGENPFLFTSILAHEALHQDTVDSSTEELINASFDSLVYLHQLLKHPSLATLGTELARRLNTKLMARINSGAGSELGLTDANTDNVYPGGTPMAKFEQTFLPLGSNDPGNAYLDKLAAAIHQTGRPVCTGLGFSSAMVDCIDANGNDHVAPSQIIKVAKTLQLRVPAS